MWMTDTPRIARVVFEVWGRPQPAGSKRAFPIRRRGADGLPSFTGRTVIVDDNPHTKSWQADVRSAAAMAMMRYGGAARDADYDPAPDLFVGPVGLAVIFTLRRPKGHFGSGKNRTKLRESAPAFPIVKPDCTKLLRAVEDACTGVVWADDAQVIEQAVSKVYGTREGAHVVVWAL